MHMIHGVIHGKRSDCRPDPGLAEGAVVIPTISPACLGERASTIRWRSADSWTSEDDEILAELEQDSSADLMTALRGQ